MTVSKRLLAALLCVSLLCGLCACADKAPGEGEEVKLLLDSELLTGIKETLPDSIFFISDMNGTQGAVNVTDPDLLALAAEEIDGMKLGKKSEAGQTGNSASVVCMWGGESAELYFDDGRIGIPVNGDMVFYETDSAALLNALQAELQTAVASQWLPMVDTEKLTVQALKVGECNEQGNPVVTLNVNNKTDGKVTLRLTDVTTDGTVRNDPNGFECAPGELAYSVTVDTAGQTVSEVRFHLSVTLPGESTPSATEFCTVDIR